MLAPGNYVQWKSRIKRYIDTKRNHELIHHCLKNPSYKFTWADKEVLISEGIDNYIYSIVDACLNACEMWKAIKRLKQGKSINVQDLETDLYWEFGKFTSRDGESLESYYSMFYKMMNELIRNQCDVTNHQVNVQFLLQLQPEWQRATQDNSPRINRSTGYENQRIGNVAGARETVDAHNVIIDSLDMSYDKEEIDQNDDDNDLANERKLLASLIEKLKCEIDESKNRQKYLETSNKVLIEKMKGEIEDFKNKNENKSLESSNNRFKEANNKLSETKNLMYTDFKKSQAELARRNDVDYALKVEIDCPKARGDLISYKIKSQKSFIKYTQTINDLN
nr:hypothetical protein [Tanacetum cinerariifolium]